VDFGNFIHVMRNNGEVQRSFGMEHLRDSGCNACRNRLIVPAQSANDFFALDARDGRIRLELWSSDGTLRSNVDVAARWFAAQPATVTSGRQPPPASVSGLGRDSANRLWLSGTVANARWKTPPYSMLALGSDGRWVSNAPGGDAGSLAGMSLTFTRPSLDYSGFNTHVDAVDPATGLVLATAMYEGELLSVLPNAYAWSKRENASGLVVIDMWRLELTRR
jgi:hypothetical protein